MQHPTGTFNDVEITDCGFGETPKSGTPHVFVIFKTEHREITGYFYLTDKSAKYTQEKLLNMGIPKDAAWDDVVQGINDGTMLIGKKVQITVDSEVYEGEARAKVNGVRPNNYEGGPRRSEAAASNAKKFGALWRKTGKDFEGSEAKEDDVPF